MCVCACTRTKGHVWVFHVVVYVSVSVYAESACSTLSSEAAVSKSDHQAVGLSVHHTNVCNHK